MGAACATRREKARDLIQVVDPAITGEPLQQGSVVEQVRTSEQQAQQALISPPEAKKANDKSATSAVDADDQMEAGICAICRSTQEGNSDIVVTTCGHEFHVSAFYTCHVLFVQLTTRYACSFIVTCN